MTRRSHSKRRRAGRSWEELQERPDDCEDPPRRRRSRLSSDRRGIDPPIVSATRCLLVAAAGAAVLGVGAVHDASAGAVEILLWLAGIGWLLFPGRRPVPRRFAVAAALGLGFLGLQLLPLPPSVLEVVSPATRELYRNTIEAVDGFSASSTSILSEDTEANEVVPRAIAGRESRFPNSWKPLSVSPYTTRRDVLRIVACGVALWIAATIPSAASLLGAVVVIAATASLLGLIQLGSGNGHVLWIFEPFDGGLLRGDRATGTFVNPDHFAMMLAMSIPAALGWLGWSLQIGEGRRRNPRPIGAAVVASAVVVLVAGVVGSASRAGLVAALLGAVAFWWGARRPPPALSRKASPAERAEAYVKRAAPIVVGTAIVAFGVGYAGPGAQETLDARVSHAVEDSDFGLGLRPAILSATLPMIGDFPLVGVGAGNWRFVFPRYERGVLVGLTHNHVHNDYVEWVVETGALGIALTLLLAAAYTGWVRSNRHIPSAVHWGLVGSIVAVGWHEAVDFGLRVPANALILSILLGLLCNPYWLARRRTAGARFQVRPAVAFGLVVFVCLSMLSARQIREALAWGKVHAGARTLPFAASDGDTWRLLGDNLTSVSPGSSHAAMQAYFTAATIQPTSGEAYWRLATLWTRTEDRLRASRSAVYTNPARVLWRVRYAALLELSGRPDLALRELETVVSRDPRPSNYWWVLKSPTEPSRPVMAAIDRGLERALEERSRDPEIALQVAFFEQYLGRHDRAGEIWLQLAEETGDWRRHGTGAGVSLARAGDLERAEEVLRHVIRVAPDIAGPYRSLALSVLEPAGRLDEAEQILERGLRSTRDRRDLYLALNNLRARRGDVEGALEVLERATKWRPGDWALHAYLGEAYSKAGKLHRAKIAYDHALGVQPNRARLHFLSGRILERLYDFGQAHRAYLRAVALAPGNPQYRRALNRIETALRKSAV